jgi:hypothetical protein
MGEQIENVSQESNVEKVPSFAELLGQSRGKGAAKAEETAPADEATAKAAETPTESTTEAASTATGETAPAAAKPVEATPAQAAPTAQAAPETPAEAEAGQMVPVSAIIAERTRRQAAEAALAQYQQPVPPQPEQMPEVADPQYERLNQKFLAQSEKAARRAHSDFDESYKAFVEACQSNPQLAHTVINSEDPGEAAYVTGKNFLIAKEHGVSFGDYNGLIAAVEKKTRDDERKKVTAEFETKLTAKAAERSKTPTDITAARAAGGAAEPEWVPPSMAQHLKSVFKRGQ